MRHALTERFRVWRDRLRTRIQRYSYSKLDFHVLTKKAENLLNKSLLEKRKKNTPQRVFDRPSYYPAPGWFRRTMMSIGNGLLLYCSLFVFFLTFKGGWYLVCFPLGGLLFSTFCYTVRALLYEAEAESVSGGVPYPFTLIRVAFFPIIEPALFVLWNIGPRSYHAVGFVDDYLKNSREDKHSERPKQEEIIRSIPQVVVEVVHEEIDRLFDTKSSYEHIHSEIASRFDSARNTKAYFERRIKNLNADQISERLSYAFKRAREACEKLEHELKRLEEWKAAIHAELNAYCTKVNEISPELDDIVHYRELDRLEKDIVLLREEAEREVAQTTIKLLSSISNRCMHLNSTLHEVGMRTALIGATSNDPEKNAVIIMETVDALYVSEPKFDLVKVAE